MEQEIRLFQKDRDLPFSIYLYDFDISAEWHCHKHLELDYCIEGTCSVKVNGEDYELNPGDLIIIHTMEGHSLIPGLGCKVLGVQIDLSVFEDFNNFFYESQYLLPFIRGKATYQQCIRAEKGSILENILSEILIEYQKKLVGYEMYIRGNILRLFAYLIRTGRIENIDKKSNAQEMQRIKPVLDYMETNMGTEFSISLAARMCCMSYYHFCRLFKKITGRTFVEYQNFVRIKQAERLLVTTDFTILEIALKTGFGSVAYFTRVFKKEVGDTPAHYRKKMKI